MKMKVLELFCGTKSISKVFMKRHHLCTTVDNKPIFKPNYESDLTSINYFFMKQSYDVIWASPPCTTFSVASIGTHWRGVYEPKTKACKLGLKLLENTIKIISIKKPKYWFIENPRGVMRKVIDKYFKKYKVTGVIRHTVTYCQYGDKRMKPTDIWTNNPHWKPKPMCKNGSPCHESAPRGSKTGTQGLKNAKLRGVIPQELCKEIVQACEYDYLGNAIKERVE